MTAEQLLEKLRMEKDRIESSISVIEGLIKVNTIVKKRQAIVKEAKSLSSNKKGFKYNGKHWTQLPENKARVSRLAKLMHKAKARMEK